MNFINKSKVKDFFRKNKMRVSEDVYETVNLKIEEMFVSAVERTKGNGRGTVMGWDL
ncbi:hypothetical protein HZC07_05805 [Candidatus Micrarchaeota archaeon]|nr:hypothetical protein [Candidatus Micrarchaeota archaeon]